jgi:hypothetical protein
MIDMNKKYRTRDGREVRIYATDGGNFPHWVHGAVNTDGCGWLSVTWCNMGRSSIGTELDLIEVRPRHKRRVWLNVYGNPNDVTAYNCKWKADEAVSPRIACIKIELDFEEGEGL